MKMKNLSLVNKYKVKGKFSKELLINEKIDDRRIIDLIHKNGKIWAICECKCGEIKKIAVGNLFNGRQSRCLKCRKRQGIFPYELTEDMRFNNWTVIKPEFPEKKINNHYICRCDCGNIKKVRRNSLIAKKNNYCIKCWLCNIKHGLAKSSIYKCWSALLTRCYNRKCKVYASYGGRGIRVCEQWRNFENFYADIGDRPEGLELDRIDNNGNYEPQNCKWSTHSEQQKNKRKYKWKKNAIKRGNSDSFK